MEENREAIEFIKEQLEGAGYIGEQWEKLFIMANDVILVYHNYLEKFEPHARAAIRCSEDLMLDTVPDFLKGE